MSTLALPAIPSNLRLPEGATTRVVDSDMYNICGRVKEIDPSLYIVLMEGNDKYAYAIVEQCHDGVDRVVKKVKELDERVLKALQLMMSLPLSVRVKKLEAECVQYEADYRENELERMYEEVGRPMLTQLDHDGFIPGGRGISYPKRGVAGGKGSKEKS